ncbi:aldo/keto reductase [Pontiella desulfatans]|nr:aldo/keto reductase [Pontiella desulfatans]
MRYRRLGKTAMMVSELAMGTFPFESEDSFPLFDAAIDRGINYFDCASAYSGGKVEANLGRYFKASGNREKVFLSTKLSGYYWELDRWLMTEVGKKSKAVQHEIEAKAESLLEQRRVKLPGYHIQYFGGQANQFDKTYYRYFAMQEIGISDEWRGKIKQNAYRLLEEGMTRLQTDYLDVLHIPHGVAMPEMMDDLLKEIFQEFKQKGLVKASAVSFHNDVTGNLLQAAKVGYYDVAMFAYNIANHAGLEHAMYKAHQSGMGLIAMKVAKLFSMGNQPAWRLSKLNAAIPDEGLSPFAKSYLWALQNPNLSCCVSQMETIEQLNDNLQVVGRKLDLEPS